MTNNTNSSPCVATEQLDLLLDGNAASDQAQQWEAHLSTCEECQQALSNQIGDTHWWQEAEEALSDTSDSPDAEVSATTAANDETIGGLIDLLGPTDDPRMLGRIGSYEVLGVLGYGGMGIVFKAFDAALNRYVAIKMLLPHLSASGAARKRFQREGQAAAAVVDDHVLPIYAVDQWQGVPYLVMQYCSGVNLQQRINDEGPFELKEILRVGMQAAQGLAAAHAQGLVHRDVKPSNMLLDGTVERVMLTDFGLARAADDASITKTGVIAGTPQYMSPEQAQGKTVDSASDLFGLGSVMYTLCTGHPPFRADNSYAVLRQITDEEPRDIQEINPDVPSWLCRLISKLMTKQPKDRFQSAEKVAHLLEECLAHVQQPTLSDIPQSLRSELDLRSSIKGPGGPTWIHRKGLWALAGALLFVLLSVVLIIKTNTGTLRITTNSDSNVDVVIRRKGTEVDRLTVSPAGESLRLRAGHYEIDFLDKQAELSISENSFTVTRGQTHLATIESLAKPELQPSSREGLEDAIYKIRPYLSKSSQSQQQFNRLTHHIETRWGPYVSADPAKAEIHVAQTPLAQQEIGKLIKSLKAGGQDEGLRSQENLTRIINALHIYILEKGKFPPSSIMGKNGRGGPPHSWRVELLPWLGQVESELYDRYQFEEPWDSPSNLALLSEMPEVYRCPLDEEDSTNASYFGVTSTDQSTFLGAEEGSNFQQMTDGTSQVLAIIESKRPIPWTQPTDIELPATAAEISLGSWYGRGWQAVFGDGVVAYVSRANSKETLHRLFTMNDGIAVTPSVVQRFEVREVAQVGNEDFVTVKFDGKEVAYDPNTKPLVTEDEIESIEIVAEQELFVTISITLTDKAGARQLARTKDLIDRDQEVRPSLLILFDGQPVMRPTLNAPIGKQLLITGLKDRTLVENILAHIQREIFLNRPIPVLEQPFQVPNHVEIETGNSATK